MDMMFEPSDPEYYNIHMIEAFCRTVCRSILLTSSRSVPSALGVDLVIGHLLEVRPDEKRTYELFGGLEYTPISEDFKPFQKKRTRKENIENIMVAFGGGGDLDGPRLTLKALHQIGFKGRVDILISPLSPYNRSGLKRDGFPFQITIRQNLPSVAPLIYNADLIIGSYGHITFEAMCLGTPFIVVGLKDFQIDYARR
jgi:spore coat polysaccharide biosynthesis predicted glycosyltransferase SpsG